MKKIWKLIRIFNGQMAKHTTAEKMVFMYVLNSKFQNWWNDVQLVIWGQSAELVKKTAI